MRDASLLHAVRNNAVWCAAVAQAHGVAAEWLGSHWAALQPMPRFYPNLITLTADDRADQYAAIEAMIDAAPLSGFGVKDSFAALDLAPLGFALLFEATWIVCDAPQGAAPVDLRWAVLRDADALEQWESAWNAADPAPRIFLPQLLQNTSVAVLAAYRGEQCVAGAIACRSDGVIGLSNTFAPQGEESACLAGCCRLAQAQFPGLPLVDYASGEALEQSGEAGFREVAPLRVWLRG